MTALKYDLIVKQGATYRRWFPVLGDNDQPLSSLVGWSAVGQVRASYAPGAPLLHTLDLTFDGSYLVLVIPDAVSSAWAWRLARYDVELTAPDGDVTDFLEGSVVVRPEITRSTAPSLDSFPAVFAPTF